MKRKLQQAQVAVSRKLRSSLPRRRRPDISPVILSGKQFSGETEVSCVSRNSPESIRRIVTRLYSKKRENEEREKSTVVSEASCVDSSSNLISTAEFPGKNTKPTDEITSEAVAAVSESSCVGSCSNKQNELSTAEFLPKIDNRQNELSTAEFLPKIEVSTEAKLNCSDLVCSELLLCDENQSEYSSAFSDLESDVFGRSSSEYTPSIWLESGSEFSEKSVEESPSPTFALFVQYSHQFCPSAFSRGDKSVSEIENDYRAVPMDDEEDELSYTMLRSRERRKVYMQDYAEEYCTETDYGHLVIQQRLEMVHWIVEQSTSKELQKETLFLGVSLLDRFLSKGFFKNKRNLQVAGIACLTLATRIEENQPFNSVRKRTICVGSDTYSRCEVVAMEWLVQEVLNFQCFMPTIYNFLWFYLKASKANEYVERTAKYLAVLALLGHEQLCFWPSTVAAGLVILASLSANKDALCNRVVETHVRTKEDDLSGCLKSLEWLVKYAC